MTNADIALFNAHYRTRIGDARYDFIFDLDNDGVIAANDLLLLRRKLGTRV